MRLLNAKTLQLETFIGRNKPVYAIVSHTWDEREEVLFEDIQKAGSDWQNKGGASKVLSCCRKAVEDGYDYVSIDSCCIDKGGSAELSEAINSMFRWYEGSAVCYAYPHGRVYRRGFRPESVVSLRLDSARTNSSQSCEFLQLRLGATGVPLRPSRKFI